MTMLNLILILSTLLSIQLSNIDTRVGTAAADSPTASIFGANGEVLGQCIPCVTEPNGRRLRKPFISHEALMRGGTLTFE